MSPLGDLLVVGLGNPGSRYAGTRHNVGTDTVELLASRGDSRLREDSKVSARCADVRAGDERLHLAVPMTYMNESGRAVSQLLRRHELLDWSRLVVVHDELDLEPGVVKVKLAGGLAGHNGLRDITKHLGTQDYARVRIGVGKPPGGADNGRSWVLSKLSGAAREEMGVAIVRAAEAVEAIAADGVDAAMQQFNAKG